ALLVKAGLEQSGHWKVYLTALVGSFLVMGGVLFRLERRGYLRAVFLIAISLLLLVQGVFWWSTVTAAPSLTTLAIGLFLFFLGFNTLEASQPSLASRLAPADSRGAALGVYNTSQSIGFFVGGAVG
ncbi:MFS transporter, partial [Arthrospira platensis SPKY1]|nr:MFS transporter [Arthrospira platensis SPKY1]